MRKGQVEVFREIQNFRRSYSSFFFFFGGGGGGGGGSWLKEGLAYIKWQAVKLNLCTLPVNSYKHCGRSTHREKFDKCMKILRFRLVFQ